jgi:hypothetical protein
MVVKLARIQQRGPAMVAPDLPQLAQCDQTGRLTK